jgi:hypothetical protein
LASEVVRQRGHEALWRKWIVETILEALHEGRVALGCEGEERERRLPPRGYGDVESLRLRLRKGDHTDVIQCVVAPAFELLITREDESDLEAVACAELAGVMENDAHTARELEIVDQERDPHAVR